MEQFIYAVKEACSALALMSEEWSKLSNEDNQIVQGLRQWGEAFNVSVDEVPFILWAVVDELEKMRGESPSMDEGGCL